MAFSGLRGSSMLMADITHGVLKSFSLYSSIFHSPSHQASTQLWLPRTWFQVRTPAMRAGMPTERRAQISRMLWPVQETLPDCRDSLTPWWGTLLSVE